jgi:hypothetical protein
MGSKYTPARGEVGNLAEIQRPSIEFIFARIQKKSGLLYM